MKQIYFIISLFISVFSQAQIITIPDANFKTALVDFFIADLDNDGNFNDVVDANGDGEIQVSEAAAVFGLELNGLNISSLEGIHEFTNILRLLCGNNNLTSIDISQNLSLEELTVTFNQLTVLEVTHNLNLKFLDFVTNQITSIDLSQNLSLETLICDNNEFLTGIDVSQNSNLIYLTCSNNPLLSSLNIKNGNNINLSPMDADLNPLLTCIQVDDVIYANSNPLGWSKDETAEYSENCTLGIVDYEDLTFTMFPNPATDILNIHQAQGQLIESIKIYSLQGTLVKEASSLSVDVSQLSPGLYFVKVLVNTQNSQQKSEVFNM